MEDLDLYLELSQKNDKELVYYENKNIEGISLNKDIRSGSVEAEIITVDDISKGSYSFFAHNLSGDVFDKNVVCKIIINNELYKEIRPSRNRGNYWKLFDIDMIKKNFDLINEVSMITGEEMKEVISL
ncbi:MAG: Unknown protein [uncultured Sulfurovum sp.]|uniref:Uncharacterized protein n=1 Tax=uncultured Sulfurovum sp. TaxID=269237 RepID=A0A6S6TG16_9BACT|nr:MAG: Unknown protein [uncultured Sulfurovum sp.]